MPILKLKTEFTDMAEFIELPAGCKGKYYAQLILMKNKAMQELLPILSNDLFNFLHNWINVSCDILEVFSPEMATILSQPAKDATFV